MGALARITRVQVYIIAVVLIAITVAALWFLLIKPQQDALQAATDRYNAAEPQSTDEKRREAEKNLAKANQQVAEAKAKWAVYDRRLMPDIDISNFIQGTRQLWNEQVLVLGPKVEHFLRSDSRVQVGQAGITLPAPSTDPNQVNKKAFTLPLGSVAVQGTFQNVLSDAERWNNFGRLVLVDGLSLAGTSPRLVGTYTLTAFLFTHGEPSTETVPQATQSGFGGGFGGFPGGPPEGMPGMPPEGGPGGPPGDYPGRGGQ